MSVLPSVSSDVEIQVADGTWLWLSLVESYDADGNVQDKTLATRVSALLADVPLTQQLQSKPWQNRGLGIGLDYHAAYGLYTRTPGIVTPAGRAQSVQVPLAAGYTTSSLVAIEEFGASLYVAQTGAAATYGGRIIRSSDGTGTGGGAFANVTMTNYGGLGYITAGEYIRDLCPFGDGTGARYLYASSSDANGVNGRLHRTVDGTNWTSTAAGTFGPYGRNRLARVLWTDRSGLSWPRLVSISGPNLISYTKVGADPFLAASWIEGVEIDTAKVLIELGSARRHVWMRSQDNVYDVNEYGESTALQDYDTEASPFGALLYLKEHLYVASGRTCTRLYVGEPSVALQEAAQHCFPGWGTPAENDVHGYVTALTKDQGHVVAALFNPITHSSFICWGSDQGVPQGHRNPLLWYGPEAVADTDYRVTRLKTSGLAGDLRLWIASMTAGSTPVLHHLSLPISGAPLQDLISGGAMRFNDTTGAGFWQRMARLHLMPPDWTGATSIVDQARLLARGLSITRAADGSLTNDGFGTKLVYRVMADPAPGAVTALALPGPGADPWPSGVDVTTAPSQTVVPTATTRGERIWQRIDFASPRGANSPPKIGVLDACIVDAWSVAPTAIALPTLTVQYGAGIRSLTNGDDTRDPSWVTAQLAALVSAGRTTIQLQDGTRYLVKFEQLLETATTYTGNGPNGGRVVTAQLSGLLLGGA